MSIVIDIKSRRQITPEAKVLEFPTQQFEAKWFRKSIFEDVQALIDISGLEDATDYLEALAKSLRVNGCANGQ